MYICARNVCKIQHKENGSRLPASIHAQNHLFALVNMKKQHIFEINMADYGFVIVSLFKTE